MKFILKLDIFLENKFQGDCPQLLCSGSWLSRFSLFVWGFLGDGGKKGQNLWSVFVGGIWMRGLLILPSFTSILIYCKSSRVMFF